jgi:hypothetical protein
MSPTATLKNKSTMDTSNFDAGITRMGQRVSAFGSGQLRAMGGAIAGAFTVGAISGWVKEAMRAAESITDVGRATGVTSEQIQTLHYLTTQYGGSINMVNTAIERLRRTQGSTAGVGIANKIGMTPDAFRTAPTSAVLEALATYYKRTGDANTVTQALGRGTIELSGVLNELATGGFANATAAAKSFGAVMRDETIAQLDELNDRLEGMAMRWRSLWGGITVGTANLFSNIGRAGTKAMAESDNLEKWLIAGVAGKFLGNLFGQGNEAQQEAEAEYYKKRAEQFKQTRMQRGATAEQIETEKAALREKILSQMGGKGGGLKIEAADSYARLGGFIGGQSNPMTSIARQQLELAKRMEQHTGKSVALETQIADNTANLNEDN